MKLRPIEWDSKITKYPTGETYSEWTDSIDLSCLYHAPDIRTWDDLMNLKALDDTALRLARDKGKPWYFVPYFPFARDDRRRGGLGTNPLQLAIDMLGELRYRIIIADPHSYATEVFSFIPQATVVKEFMFKRYMFEGHPLIVIPDEGAAKKAYSWINDVPNSGVIQGKKYRDPQTGKLSGFGLELTGGLTWDTVKGCNVVIIDDICDGGGTFLGLADQLDAAGVNEIRFGVTHGLFTNPNNLQTMRDRFSIVTCMSDDPALTELNPIFWDDLIESEPELS